LATRWATGIPGSTRPVGAQRPSSRGSTGAGGRGDRLLRQAQRAPQTVAGLTADTFVQVIVSFGTFDPAKGSARAWVFCIARRV
jgi:hypothetical protein